MYVIKTITKKDQSVLFILLHYRLQFLFFINLQEKEHFVLPATAFSSYK